MADNDSNGFGVEKGLSNNDGVSLLRQVEGEDDDLAPYLLRAITYAQQSPQD